MDPLVANVMNSAVTGLYWVMFVSIVSTLPRISQVVLEPRQVFFEHGICFQSS
jgi:hypothetical protein